MNEIVNKFLLTGDKFMLVVCLLITKERIKNSCKQEIQIIIIGMIWIKLIFNIIWLMVDITIWLKKHN